LNHVFAIEDDGKILVVAVTSLPVSISSNSAASTKPVMADWRLGAPTQVDLRNFFEIGDVIFQPDGKSPR
jgi:hypothetical protein